MTFDKLTDLRRVPIYGIWPGKKRPRWYTFKVNVESEITSPLLVPAAVAFGRIGGKVSSVAKRRTARANGKLGGRPRKDREEKP